jgi:hypothetical protein
MNKFDASFGTGHNEVYYPEGEDSDCFVSYVPAGIAHAPGNPGGAAETALITNDRTQFLIGADIRCIFADVREEYSKCNSEAECLALFETLKTQHPFIEDFAVGIN